MLKVQISNPDFFGRSEDLEQLRSILQPPKQQVIYTDSNTLNSFALSGFGGVGKSQIAIQYAHEMAEEYDAILWVQADEIDKLARSFREIATALQLVHPNEVKDPVVARNILMEWLSTPYKVTSDPNDEKQVEVQEMAKWLMIFDNADKPELLRDFWPVSGHGSALVTSRDPRTKDYLHCTRSIDLESFSSDEAALFLERLTSNDSKNQANHNVSLKLGDHVGGFPLALVHFASIIRRQVLTLREALERYEREAFRLELLHPSELSPHDKYNHTLLTVWKFEKFSPVTGHILDLISFLDPDNISELVVKTDVNRFCLSGQIDPEDSYDNARTSLVGSSLVSRLMDRDELRVHRVVQEMTRMRLSAERLYDVFSSTTETLLEAWPHDPEEKFTHMNSLWDVARLVSPHVTQMKIIYEQKKPKIKPPASFAFARLLQKHGW